MPTPPFNWMAELRRALDEAIDNGAGSKVATLETPHPVEPRKQTNELSLTRNELALLRLALEHTIRTPLLTAPQVRALDRKLAVATCGRVSVAVARSGAVDIDIRTAPAPAHRVADAIRKLIKDGELQPRTRIDFAALRRRVGTALNRFVVSSPTLRTALLILSGESPALVWADGNGGGRRWYVTGSEETIKASLTDTPAASEASPAPTASRGRTPRRAETSGSESRSDWSPVGGRAALERYFGEAADDIDDCLRSVESAIDSVPSGSAAPLSFSVERRTFLFGFGGELWRVVITSARGLDAALRGAGGAVDDAPARVAALWGVWSDRPTLDVRRLEVITVRHTDMYVAAEQVFAPDVVAGESLAIWAAERLGLTLALEAIRDHQGHLDQEGPR